MNTHNNAEVIPFRTEPAAGFERLNRRWIEEYFVVEAADLAIFTDPFGSVVQSGGQVLFVVENGKAVGTCAVIRHDARSFDLAKVSVEPESQGRGYGDLLVKRAIAFARDAGAERLMLLTNSRLTAAVPLYEKHGFRPVTVSHAEHYSRVDLEMELRLKAGDRAG